MFYSEIGENLDKNNYTKTPWYLDEEEDIYGVIKAIKPNYYKGKANEEKDTSVLICCTLSDPAVNPKERLANLFFILDAVNNHEQLLETCKESLKKLYKFYADNPFKNSGELTMERQSKLLNIFFKLKKAIDQIDPEWFSQEFKEFNKKGGQP